MLQITPEFQAQLREFLAAREQNTEIRERSSISAAPRHRQLGSGAFKRLVEFVAGILHEGRPTLFAFEAGCRHGVRSSLCLQGWCWNDADLAAASVLSTALALAGGERPSWQQGQPEYTQDGHSPIERTRCVYCHRKMEPSENGSEKKFCSHLCRVVHTNRIARLSGERVSRAEYFARIAVEKKLRIEQLERDCEHCGKAFTPKFTNQVKQRFCSQQCHYDAARVLSAKQCEHCGTSFQPRRSAYKYCSPECGRTAGSAALRAPAASCQWCGACYDRKKHGLMFCSRSCATQSAQAAATASLDRRRPERQCPACKTMFRVKPSSPKTFCTRQCASNSRYRCSDVSQNPAASERSE